MGAGCFAASEHGCGWQGQRINPGAKYVHELDPANFSALPERVQDGVRRAAATGNASTPLTDEELDKTFDLLARSIPNPRNDTRIARVDGVAVHWQVVCA